MERHFILLEFWDRLIREYTRQYMFLLFLYHGLSFYKCIYSRLSCTCFCTFVEMQRMIQTKSKVTFKISDLPINTCIKIDYIFRKNVIVLEAYFNMRLQNKGYYGL